MLLVLLLLLLQRRRRRRRVSSVNVLLQLQNPHLLRSPGLHQPGGIQQRHLCKEITNCTCLRGSDCKVWLLHHRQPVSVSLSFFLSISLSLLPTSLTHFAAPLYLSIYLTLSLSLFCFSVLSFSYYILPFCSSLFLVTLFSFLLLIP